MRHQETNPNRTPPKKIIMKHQESLLFKPISN